MGIGIGIVGYGYWGPRLARNFAARPECKRLSICELREDRVRAARGMFPAARVTSSYQELLADNQLQAIVVATPASSHFALARAALEAGKDVLVEKPLTTSVFDARQLVELADRYNRILAVDHTFLYTGAVRKIKELIESGEIGELYYVDSVRTNLGLFQIDQNVIYDLAPHELSILRYLVGRSPRSIQAHGVCHAGNGVENLAYLHVDFGNNLIAHFHLNWLAPVKIRRMLIAGSRKMIVYDDMDREKVRVYDKGIAVTSHDVDAVHRAIVDYRMGDMVAPHIDNREALEVVAEHFLACVRDRTTPLVSGEDGLRVVEILEASQQSLQQGGQRVLLERPTTRRLPRVPEIRAAA